MLKSIKHYTHAGQTYSHSIRMWVQAVQNWFLGSLVAFFFIFWLIFLFIIPSAQQRHDMVTYAKVVPIYHAVTSLRENQTPTIQSFGDFLEVMFLPEVSVPTERGVVKMTMQQAYGYILNQHVEIVSGRIVWVISVISLVMGMIFALLVGWWLATRGGKLEESRVLRGSTEVDVDVLVRDIKKQKKDSPFSIVGVPLIKDSEVQGGCISGTQGSGKTVLISDMLSQIRGKGQRAMVYDRKGTYIKRFYREGKDIILNPFDTRSPAWNLWAECDEAMDFDNVAASMMPINGGSKDNDGPFWVKAARILFSVTANSMKQDRYRSSRKLLRSLYTSDIESIKNVLKNTEAESLASDKVEKMALSVKAVLTTYTRCLKYVFEGKQGEEAFSIRKWIKREEDDSWIFISCPARYREVLRPLMTTWIDIYCNGVMELPVNRDRRMWLWLDEMHTLQELPSLPEAIALGREYGFCPWFSVQTISQLHKNFGSDTTEELLDLANTFFVLRANGDTSALKWAKIIGEMELQKPNENISFGSNEIRDGVSLSTNDVMKPLVMASQIQNLNDLEGYLKLPGNWPVTKVTFEWKPYAEVAADFIARRVNADNLSESRWVDSADETEDDLEDIEDQNGQTLEQDEMDFAEEQGEVVEQTTTQVQRTSNGQPVKVHKTTTVETRDRATEVAVSDINEYEAWAASEAFQAQHEPLQPTLPEI